MTVVGESGAGVDVVDVEVAGADGLAAGAEGVVAGTEEDVPGVPTAQQFRMPAQETALSCPVPAGAGCPTTSGVPDWCPRTGGPPEPLGAVVVVQAAAVSPSVTSSTTPRISPVSRARRGRRDGLQGTAGGQ